MTDKLGKKSEKSLALRSKKSGTVFNYEDNLNLVHQYEGQEKKRAFMNVQPTNKQSNIQNIQQASLLDPLKNFSVLETPIIKNQQSLKLKDNFKLKHLKSLNLNTDFNINQSKKQMNEEEVVSFNSKDIKNIKFESSIGSIPKIIRLTKNAHSGDSMIKESECNPSLAKTEYKLSKTTNKKRVKKVCCFPFCG